jgi:hypothetical protein
MVIVAGVVVGEVVVGDVVVEVEVVDVAAAAAPIELAATPARHAVAAAAMSIVLVRIIGVFSSIRGAWDLPQLRASAPNITPGCESSENDRVSRPPVVR